jgi:hypothetical protein
MWKIFESKNGDSNKPDIRVEVKNNNTISVTLSSYDKCCISEFNHLVENCMKEMKINLDDIMTGMGNKKISGSYSIYMDVRFNPHR